MLTPTQKNILIRMDRGEVLYVTHLGKVTAFLSDRPVAVRWQSYLKFRELGLIEDKADPKERWRMSEYHITKKGRKAVPCEGK